MIVLFPDPVVSLFLKQVVKRPAALKVSLRITPLIILKFPIWSELLLTHNYRLPDLITQTIFLQKALLINDLKGFSFLV